MDLSSKWNTPLAKQIWISSGVLLSIFGQGMVLGYPPCLLPALRAPDSPIPTDINAATWIASATGISNMLGCFTSTLFMDHYGRRMVYFVNIIPTVIGWLFIYFASNVPMLIVGRVLGGITGGATGILGAIVIGEYTSPKIRGILLNLKTTALCLGTLVVHLIGSYYHWRTVAILSLIPQFIALIITWTWPESPAWLASKKQFERSAEDYFWLRGKSPEAKKEFEELIQAQKEKFAIPTPELNFGGRILRFFKRFTEKDFIKPIVIVTFGGILFEACGRHVFPTYAKDIIGSFASTDNQAFYYILIIDVIVTTTTTLSSILVKIMNRRTLLFSTGFPALIVLLSVSLYLFLTSNNLISNVPWLAFSGFSLFIILSNMGCTLIPFILLGEIFPLAHRSVGTAVIATNVSVFILIAVKTTPFLLLTIKVYGTLAVLGLFMAISLLLLYFMQPETKDKTLQEIENYFNHGKYNNCTHNDYEAGVKIITSLN